MILFFIMSNIFLLIFMFYSKNQVLSIPIFIIGLFMYILDIYEMRKKNEINILQITRGGFIVFFEFILLLSYFFHFLDFLYK